MIEILNRYTKAVLYSSETAQTIAEAVAASKANLNGANLRGANLRGADLREANLRGANLREANLNGAKQHILRIQGSRHELNAVNDDVMIGCEWHPLAWWLEHYRAVGRQQEYTPQQIAEYRGYLAVVKHGLKLYPPEGA